MIKKITDINDSQLDIFTKYNEAQLLHYFEPHGGVFIAETPMIIGRALDAGCEALCWLVEEKCIEAVSGLIERGSAVAGMARQTDEAPKDVPVFTASMEVLNALTGFHLTRGVLCAMRRPKQQKPREILKMASCIAVLEDVMNPTNMGAIFRSAAALGADAALITKKSTNPLYRRACRVSMGTVFQLPWAIADENWIQELKEAGFSIVSMALSGVTADLNDERLKRQEKIAVVFGTEGSGISQETLRASDYIAKIPMTNGVDSLNVAATSAVTFWELFTK